MILKSLLIIARSHTRSGCIHGGGGGGNNLLPLSLQEPIQRTLIEELNA